jgi:hypothetical protein
LSHFETNSVLLLAVLFGGWFSDSRPSENVGTAENDVTAVESKMVAGTARRVLWRFIVVGRGAVK